MPARRRPARQRIDRLSFEQADELTIGPHIRGSAFVSAEERRQAWLHHRNQLMAATGATGGPWAFWHIDPAPEHLRDFDGWPWTTHEAAIAAMELLSQERQHWLDIHAIESGEEVTNDS